VHAFRDSRDRAWTLSLTVDGINQVRALTGLDLLTALDGDLLGDLAADIVLTVDVLYSLLKGDADRRGLSDLDFGQSLRGDALAEGFTALACEVLGYFPTAEDVDGEKPGKAPDDGLKASQRAERFTWELAGIVGVHPGPFTLRDLFRMARGKQKDEWGRFSHLIAATENVMRTGELVKASDRNPFTKHLSSEPGPADSRVGEMKGMFPKRLHRTGKRPKKETTAT
jgi:hypothetical protein